MCIMPFSHKKVEKTLESNFSCSFALEQSISQYINYFLDITQVDYFFWKLNVILETFIL